MYGLHAQIYIIKYILFGIFRCLAIFVMHTLAIGDSLVYVYKHCAKYQNGIYIKSNSCHI